MRPDADAAEMDYVHACAFCGWSRAAGSATVLIPHCERCGCNLHAVGAREFERSRTPQSPIHARIGPRGGRAAVFALGAVLLFAMARAGFVAGGAPIALAAVGLAALLAAPLLASVLDGRRR